MRQLVPGVLRQVCQMRTSSSKEIGTILVIPSNLHNIPRERATPERAAKERPTAPSGISHDRYAAPTARNENATEDTSASIFCDCLKYSGAMTTNSTAALAPKRPPMDLPMT